VTFVISGTDLQSISDPADITTAAA